MVLGRTHIKDVAAKRKVELNSYIQSLMNTSTDVSEVIMKSILMTLFQNSVIGTVNLAYFFVFITSVILFILSSIPYSVMKKRMALME